MSIEGIVQGTLMAVSLVCGTAGAAAVAAATPEQAVEAQAAQQVVDAPRLLERLLGGQASPVRELDPAIFTELQPVTASELPVRLPPDQREND